MVKRLAVAALIVLTGSLAARGAEYECEFMLTRFCDGKLCHYMPGVFETYRINTVTEQVTVRGLLREAIGTLRGAMRGLSNDMLSITQWNIMWGPTSMTTIRLYEDRAKQFRTHLIEFGEKDEERIAWCRTR